ncbi:heterokaryon incompatibility protein-domain-containing protein [Cubamyces lactineus]|nr:heterokaryon incompatibility protein-domain-containing protein [Cubamyces lactineus]
MSLLVSNPQSICASWEGVFAARFGIRDEQIERHWETDKKRRYWTGGYQYTVSSSAWLACSRSGCAWCRFLERQFLATLRESSWPISSVHVQVGSEDGPFYVDTEVEKPPGTVDTLTIIVNDNPRKFDLYTDRDDPAATCVNGRTRVPDVGSTRTLALAKACVEECVRDHVQCQAITPHPVPVGSAAPLPTRLIDCSNLRRVRVVETDSTMRGAYAALSYVWGVDHDQSHRCTRTNLSSYMTGIDLMDLPLTIRDAIYVTHSLGIPFLWNDSLCIIQDAPEDMNRELASMRDVYRHSSLTIDAASAASVADGFLEDRRFLDPDATLPWICPGGEVGTVYLMVRDPYNNSPNPDVLTGGWDQTNHTNTRAWCLQEALLSTRSLVFTSETVQLRCHSSTQNIGGAQHRADADLCRLPDAVFHPEQPVAHDSEEWRSIRTSWCDAIQDYSCRALSDPSEKLVACAGLAELFARVLRSDYLAGLWRESLLRDLLWFRRENRHHALESESPKGPQGYRAPSWSWATIDAGVLMMTSSDGKPLVEVVECTVLLKDKTLLPFGPVLGGSLVLRTQWRLHPCKRSSSAPHRPGYAVWLQSRCATRSVQIIDHGSGADEETISLPDETRSELCEATFDCEDDIDAGDLFIIPILQQSYTIKMSGLVVRVARVEQDLQGNQRVLYRRVGYWRAYNCSDGLGDLECSSDEWFEIVLV